ncbi:hypothetical protein INR49_010215 [Caranx melampygus]|nr:hypothetical protein INR49_010215 [Caranx melampygus]
MFTLIKSGGNTSRLLQSNPTHLYTLSNYNSVFCLFTRETMPGTFNPLRPLVSNTVFTKVTAETSQHGTTAKNTIGPEAAAARQPHNDSTSVDTASVPLPRFLAPEVLTSGHGSVWLRGGCDLQIAPRLLSWQAIITTSMTR